MDTASFMSWVLIITSCNMVGLKAFTQTLNGSNNPSVNSITNLCSEISVTMTVILWNYVIYATGVPVYLNYANSLKWISGSFLSNQSINLWVKTT